MIKVLLSVYACMPNEGTEPGNGWGWAVHLAQRGLEVHAFTAFENGARIEDHLRRHPVRGLQFHYIDYPTKLLKSDGARYVAWQYALVKAARSIHAQQHFDIAHHVTYGSVHVPSQLWRLGIPVVFGPVGGAQTAPRSMLRYFEDAAGKERRRTALTRLLRYSPLHRRSLSSMSAVLASNTDTLRLVKELGAHHVELMFDAALPDDFLAPAPRQFVTPALPLKILWVGRMLPRKALPLTLDIFARVQAPATLTIIGDGLEQNHLRSMIESRGLTDRVFWAGRRLPWDEVRQAYSEHDLMLFTSLRESGGAQLAEAMALGLPIVTLNLHGPGDLVPDDAGIKVDVISPKQVIADAAAAIDRYAATSPQERSAMSEAGWRFAKQLTYSVRAAQAEALYRRILRLPPLASD